MSKIEIPQDEWFEVKVKINDLHKAFVGDGLGNDGYMQRMNKVETYVEGAKKRHWFERGVFAVITVVVTYIYDIISGK